jgi:pimeloyl-ACP methyl ester carboxylesterase
VLRAEKLPFGQPAVYLAARFAADSLSGQPAVMPSIPPRSHLLVLRRLTRFYSIEIAKAYAQHKDLPWGNFAALDDLRRLLIAAPAKGAKALADFHVRSATLDYRIFARPACKTTLLAFTGSPFQFGGPIDIMHRWLTNLEVNIVYIYDSAWCFCLGPMKGLGMGFDENAAMLQVILDSLGTSRCLSIGNSGGGFSALMFSTRLAVDRCLVFSPPTTLKESVPWLRRRLLSFDGLLDGDGCIAVNQQIAARHGAGQTRVLFPNDHERDKIAAMTLKSLPNMDLSPLLGHSVHNILPRLAADGLLQGELDWLVQAR